MIKIYRELRYIIFSLMVMPAFLASVGIVTSCSSSKTMAQSSKSGRPEWVDNVSSKYHDGFYIASLGTGDTHDAAKRRAAAGISERFKTSIKVEQRYYQEYKSLTDQGGQMTETGSEEMDRQIDTYSDQTLMNIAYGDYYTDEVGKVYVVAYIDRMQTAPIYADKIRENDALVSRFWQSHNSEEDIISKYAYVNAAYIISLNNQVLREQLQIIEQSQVPPVVIPHGEIVEARAKAASQVKFSIDLKGTDENTKAEVSEILTRDGFSVVADEAAILHINGNTSLEPVELDREGLQFYIWKVNLHMDDNKGNRVFSLSHSGRDGGKSESAAKRVCYRSINKYLNKEFSSELDAFFDKATTR